MWISLSRRRSTSSGPDLPAWIIACLLLSGLPLSTHAQTRDELDSEPEETALQTTEEPFEEIIEVTARRRKEDIQKIPVSVTAFDDQTLKDRSAHDLSDLSEMTANMDFSISGGFSDGTSDAVIVIRGVGQIDTALFSDSGVGIYIDGVYMARAQGGVLDLLDVDRVEVLRGPQGTLFGKNTNGGAIQLVSRRPGPERAGNLSLTTGRFDRLDARASISLPLSDTLRSSLAWLSTHRDGWSESQVTGQDFYDDRRDVGRFALAFDPTDSLSAQLALDFTRERENGGSQILVGIRDTPLIGFYNQVLSEQGFDPYTLDLWQTSDFSRNFALLPGVLNRDLWGAHFDLNRQWRKGAFRSITAYRTFAVESASDGDGSTNIFAEREAQQEHYQVSQELQLSGSTDQMQWLLGVLFFRERPKETNTQRILGDLYTALELAPGPIYAPPGAPGFLCNPGPPPEGVPCFGGAGNPANLAFFVGPGTTERLDLETESRAVFGEATWGLSDRLSLTLGGRYTADEKSFGYIATNGFGAAFSDLFNEGTWNDWSGRLSLSFQASPSMLVYGTVSRGFKSGGFNGRPQQRPALDAFDPETVLSWELGAKSDWLNRRLRLNASAFFNDYDDIHFAASVDVDGMPVFITQNAGDSRIWGAEIDLRANPVPAVEISASVGHLDTEIIRLAPRVPEDSVRLGNVLPKSPSWTCAFGLQGSRQLKNRSALVSRLDYNYREKTYPDFANSEPVSQEAYGLLGARLLYSPPSGVWDIALFGTNLTDEQYLEAGFSTGAFGLDIGIAGRPREWGLEASLRF